MKLEIISISEAFWWEFNEISQINHVWQCWLPSKRSVHVNCCDDYSELPGKLKGQCWPLWCWGERTGSRARWVQGFKKSFGGGLTSEKGQTIKLLGPTQKTSVLRLQAILSMSWCLSVGFAFQRYLHGPMSGSCGVWGWRGSHRALAISLAEWNSKEKEGRSS